MARTLAIIIVLSLMLRYVSCAVNPAKASADNDKLFHQVGLTSMDKVGELLDSGDDGTQAVEKGLMKLGLANLAKMKRNVCAISVDCADKAAPDESGEFDAERIDLFVKLNKMLAEVIGKEKRSLFQNKVKSTCSAWEKIYDKNYDDAMLRKIRKLNETQVKQITIALKKYHDVVEESDAYGNAYQIRQRFNEAILKSKDKHFRPSKKRKSKQKKSSASSLMSSNSSFFINFMRIVLSFCLCYVS